MFAKNQDSPVTPDSQVECRGNHDFAAGTFQIQLSSSFDAHEWDQIESGIEQAGSVTMENALCQSERHDRDENSPHSAPCSAFWVVAGRFHRSEFSWREQIANRADR